MEPQDFRFDIPIVKVDKEKRLVRGVATGEVLDSDGEVVDYESAKEAFKSWNGNIREMHQMKAVGRSVEVEFDDAKRQIIVTSYISKGAPDTWEKCLDGTLGFYSIGAKLRDRRVEQFGGVVAKRLIVKRIGELSLVDKGACPTASFDIVKVDGGTPVGVQPADEPVAETAVEDPAAEKAETTDEGVTKTEASAAKTAAEQVDAALDAAKRDIPKSERDKMPKKQFAGENETFPIEEPKDVRAAARSLGRTKQNRAKVKARIIAIAYDMGDTYVAQLPKAWRRKDDQAAKSESLAPAYLDLDVTKGRPETYDIDRILAAIMALEDVLASEMFEANAGEDESAQIGLLRASIKSAMAFLVSEFEEQFNEPGDGQLPTAADVSLIVEMAEVPDLIKAAVAVVTKAAARGEAHDKATVQRMHDLTTGLGATCVLHAAETAEKAETVTDPAAAADPETAKVEGTAGTVQKLEQALDATKAAIEEQKATIAQQAQSIEKLQKQVEEYGEQPRSGGPAAREVHEVEKTVAGGQKTGAGSTSREAVLGAYDTIAKAATTDAERLRIAQERLQFMHRSGAGAVEPVHGTPVG